MFSWAPKPQHLESYLRLRKCSLLASERNPGSCSLHLHMWVWTRLPSPAGWPGPQSPRPGGSWAVPLVALAVDVTQRRHTAETSVRVLSEGTPSPCLFCTCLYSASSVWGVSTKGGVQDTSGGASVLTEAISVPPQSPLIYALLFTGSPGHSGSTSMSPSAALSTGKPMDSHPSYTDTPVSAPRTLSAVGPPLNTLGSPYRVITSAMGPPSGALAAPPGLNLVAPPSSQVGALPVARLPGHLAGSPRLLLGPSQHPQGLHVFSLTARASCRA